jgi:hypothetical protein
MIVRDVSITGVGIGAAAPPEHIVAPVPMVEPTDRFHGERTTNE